jgi:uncharacterized GH25 family protein
MTLLRTAGAAALALAALAAPLSAQAHRAWILPTSTVLSGEDPWVTVDAAISNDLFYADHNAMQLGGVAVTGPDGAKIELKNPSTGKYRSTFDVQLAQPGTYRIVNASDGLMASYVVGTETKRWRGTAAELATAIPKDAKDVKLTQNQRRVETFVTRGAPTEIKTTGQGLELAPVTHPNDLVAGEPAKFRLLLDGKPAAGLEVEVAQGGSRYVPAPVEQKVTTGADGGFEIKWPGPGMYFIEAAARGGPATIPNATRSASYAATFEVLPD